MKSSERQQQILSCAKRVFAERGFHAANISHICRAAGIGRGTLYQYFTNKKSVFEAIVRECLSRVQALVEDEAPFPKAESVRREEVLTWSSRRLRRVLESVFQDEQTLRILLREAVGLDASVEQILGEIDQTLIGVVAADLARAQRAGIARPELDPTHTATLMVGGVEKLALAALRSDQPVDLDRLSLEASRLHLVGTLSDRVRP